MHIRELFINFEIPSGPNLSIKPKMPFSRRKAKEASQIIIHIIHLYHLLSKKL